MGRLLRHCPAGPRAVAGAPPQARARTRLPKAPPDCGKARLEPALVSLTQVCVCRTAWHPAAGIAPSVMDLKFLSFLRRVRHGNFESKNHTRIIYLLVSL